MSDLLALSIENYRSFCDPQVISFGSEGMRTITGIYGPNAGGKTNIAHALQTIKNCIVNSSQANWTLPYDPFLLKRGMNEQPSKFVVDFIQDGRIFKYTLMFDREKVLLEELKERPSTSKKMRTIFSRTAQELNKDAYRQGFNKKLLERTRPETLLITKGHEDNNEYANLVFDFFWNILVEFDDIEARSAQFLNALKENPPLKEAVLQLLKICDFSIQDIVVEEKPIPENVLNAFPITDELRDSIAQNGVTHAATLHLVRDAELSIDGDVAFDFWAQESAGTHQFFRMAVPMVLALARGGIVYMDEFGASLHHRLVSALLDFFKKSSTEHSAKLVFNTHDTGLMGKAIDRESIILVERNIVGASIVTPLLDRHVRKDEPIEKRYREGFYGGVPFVKEA